MKFGILGDAKIAREKILSAIVAAGHEIIQIGDDRPHKGRTLSGVTCPSSLMKHCWQTLK